MTTNPMQKVPELPTLDSGIHLLETDDRTSGALQSLVLDHLLAHGTPTRADFSSFATRSRTCRAVENDLTTRSVGEAAFGGAGITLTLDGNSPFCTCVEETVT